MTRCAFLIAACAVGGTSRPGDSWPEFRGPYGSGRSDAVGLPHDWSETKNVVWKTPIPQKGWSSPVVWGKQIWLTTATPEGKELYVLCVDRDTGKVLVNAKLFDVPQPKDTAKFNSFASPSPVIEEGRVYVHFGSDGTACLDTKTAKLLWARRDLPCDHWRGSGSSPLLLGDHLMIPFDGFDLQYVVALDRKSGKTVWKTDRTHDFGTDDGDRKKNYCTPTLIEVDGKPQLVTSAAAMAAVAHDPVTGKEIWRVPTTCHSTGTRPLFGHGLVYVCTANPHQLLAIRPDGKGDVSATHVAWKSNRGVGQKTSPILVDDLLYLVSDASGTATCLDAKTGQEVWQQRLVGTFTASPIYADGVIYCFNDSGTSVAFKPGRTFTEIARSKLDSGCKATPAIAGKALFVRTETHLYRIEKR